MMGTIAAFLAGHNLSGLIIGAFTFLIIGLFHPLVIKTEYYIGTRSWILFLLLGLIAAVFSAAAENIVISVLCGVTAFASFWSIIEVFQQRKRVLRGWFPENPRKKWKNNTGNTQAKRNKQTTIF